MSLVGKGTAENIQQFRLLRPVFNINGVKSCIFAGLITKVRRPRDKSCKFAGLVPFMRGMQRRTSGTRRCTVECIYPVFAALHTEELDAPGSAGPFGVNCRGRGLRVPQLQILITCYFLSLPSHLTFLACSGSLSCHDVLRIHVTLRFVSQEAAPAVCFGIFIEDRNVRNQS